MAEQTERQNPSPGSARQRVRVAVTSPFVDRKHGTERQVAEVLSRLSDEYEFHVYSSRVEDVSLDRIVWHRVPALPGPHLLGYLWWLAANTFQRWRDRRFRGLTPDLVYSPGVNCLDADAITVHAIFAHLRERMRPELRLVGSPMLLWPQIIHRRLYYRLIASLERRVYRRPNASLAAVSQSLANDLKRTFERPDGVAVIYSGIGLDQFSAKGRESLRDRARSAFHLADTDFALLLIGNDWKSKGLATLLEAVRRAGDSRLQTLVVGADNAAAFAPLIEQMGLSARVQFLPLRSDVEFYYAAADAYVGPSLQDAFALPVAEAMASGLAVIASRAAGVAEWISPEVNGFILENPADSVTLAALIQRLAADPSLCQRVGLAAEQSVRQYGWEQNARQMSELFERAGKRKRPQ